jgi:hypothetical protein
MLRKEYRCTLSPFAMYEFAITPHRYALGWLYAALVAGYVDLLDSV